MSEQCATEKSVDCPWCGKPIMFYETSAKVDGEIYHLNCAAEDADNATWDIDMGSSS